jgi:hypothetical protein
VQYTKAHGVFAVHRSVFDHPIFPPEKFSEREAWLWLIGAAAWKPSRVRAGRALVDLERGQLAFATRFLANRWRWTEARVRRFLKKLQGDAMIAISATHEMTHITICNYDKYAFGRRADERDDDAPEEGPPSHRRRKEEERNKENNKNKPSASPAAKEFGIDADVDVVDEEPKARLFRIGKTLLVSFGIPEKRTGPLIGLWLKQRSDPAGILAAIEFARQQNVPDPIAYISAVVSSKDKRNGPKNKSATERAAAFAEQAAVMKQVPPLPGEEALYAWIGSLLSAADNDPQIKQTLKETAAEAEREMVTPFLQWRYNGRSAGNGWNSPINNAEWGTDYLNRTATAKSNMFENLPTETKYIYTDDDSQGQQLNGENTYVITFAKVPPVDGFWSLTLYNSEHFFHPNPLNRYSLGTKNKSLKYNADGSLTLYAGAKSPGADKESNWLPASNGPFSLYIRAYWANKDIIDGQWKPPIVSRVQ